MTLQVLHAVELLPDEVVLWGRGPGNAERITRHPNLADLQLTVATSALEAVDQADLVITATSARTPVLEGDWIKDGALVIAVRADSPGKRECDEVVL